MDITDLLQIEEELRVQKTHFERLFESAPEGLRCWTITEMPRRQQSLSPACSDLKEKTDRARCRSNDHLFGSKDEVRTALKSGHERGERPPGVPAAQQGRAAESTFSLIAVPVDSAEVQTWPIVLCQDIT